jgi:hypothetical protein
MARFPLDYTRYPVDYARTPRVCLTTAGGANHIALRAGSHKYPTGAVGGCTVVCAVATAYRHEA